MSTVSREATVWNYDYQLKITLYRIPFFQSLFLSISLYAPQNQKKQKSNSLCTKKFQHGKSLWINIGLKVWLFWRCPDIYLFTRAFDDVSISDDIRNIFKEILLSSKILKKKKIGNKNKNLTQQEEKKNKDRSRSFSFFCCVRLFWWRLLRARFTLWAHTVNVLFFFFFFFLKGCWSFCGTFFLSRRTRGSRDGRLYTTARCNSLSTTILSLPHSVCNL